MSSEKIVFVFTAGISTLQILQRPTKGEVSVYINILLFLLLSTILSFRSELTNGRNQNFLDINPSK